MTPIALLARGLRKQKAGLLARSITGLLEAVKSEDISVGDVIAALDGVAVTSHAGDDSIDSVSVALFDLLPSAHTGRITAAGAIKAIRTADAPPEPKRHVRMTGRKPPSSRQKGNTTPCIRELYQFSLEAEGSPKVSGLIAGAIPKHDANYLRRIVGSQKTSVQGTYSVACVTVANAPNAAAVREAMGNSGYEPANTADLLLFATSHRDDGAVADLIVAVDAPFAFPPKSKHFAFAAVIVGKKTGIHLVNSETVGSNYEGRMAFLAIPMQRPTTQRAQKESRREKKIFKRNRGRRSP